MIGGLKLGQTQPYFEINQPIPTMFDDVLEFNKSSLRIFAALEKSVSKWIWINGEIGFGQHLQSQITTPGSSVNDYILKGKTNREVYLKAGVFLRPAGGRSRKGN